MGEVLVCGGGEDVPLSSCPIARHTTHNLCSRPRSIWGWMDACTDLG